MTSYTRHPPFPNVQHDDYCRFTTRQVFFFTFYSFFFFIQLTGKLYGISRLTVIYVAPKHQKTNKFAENIYITQDCIFPLGKYPGNFLTRDQQKFDKCILF